MMEDGLLDRFPCDAVYGLHTAPGVPVGVIATRTGPVMAGVGDHEEYLESRVRERRLARFPHFDEIQVRLQHRWPPDRVIRWHQREYPGDPCPPKTTRSMRWLPRSRLRPEPR